MAKATGGAMWQRIVMFLSCLVLSQLQLLAQPTPTYRAVFSSDGPFYTNCEGHELVPENTHVSILWDSDHNGPGGADQIPFTGMGFPEGMFGNIYDFFTQAGGDFLSPEFEGFYMYSDPEPFYLVLEHADSMVTRWTSPVVNLEPVHFSWDPPQYVFVPGIQWTCDTNSTAIPCQTIPTDVYYNLNDNPLEPVCVRTCQDGTTSVLIWNAGHDMDGTRFPIITVEAGCGDLAPANAEFDPLAWQYWSGWWDLNRITGFSLGWYTITLLDSAPCGDIDYFQGQRIGVEVMLDWTTSREENLSHFEVWSYHATYPNWLRNLGNVSATGTPSEYTFVDTNPQPASYIYYCLVMVDSNTARWPARRAYVPVPLQAVEFPTLVESPKLVGNYPNPFNATTQIEFELPVTSTVKVNIFDINGRQVTSLLDETMAAGEHSISFDGSSFASGIYFARLTAGSYSTTHKMVLLK